MNVKDKWWFWLGRLTFTTLGAVGLFQAAGIRALTGPSASIASWMIFFVCICGLHAIFEVTFNFVIAIVERRQGAA
jgi:hypothetical protein